VSCGSSSYISFLVILYDFGFWLLAKIINWSQSNLLVNF
jgi:hypothetical protein